MHGSLTLISLVDLVQWAGNSKRSGTLVLSYDGQDKKLYFQDGKVTFIGSESENERIIDFLLLESTLSQQEIHEKKSVSDTLGLPFIGYLITENIISKEIMEKIILQIARSAVTEVMKWPSGEFEFTDELPGFVLNGPIELDSTLLLMESAVTFDDYRLGNSVDTHLIADELKNNIMNGTIDLPPIPDVIQQIQDRIEDPYASIEKIVDCITDQILVANILRICNSPHYRTTTTIYSIKEAVVHIGLKSLMSIVAVHALSSFSPQNADEVRKVLKHSLACGIISRQIAYDLRGNFEQAFISGLLHDIGKTIMLGMLNDYMLSPELRARVIKDYHTEIGYLLAKKWNFGEDIQECIRYHHSPDNATINRSLVEIVSTADAMAHTSDQPGSQGEIFLSMAQCRDYSDSHVNSVEIHEETAHKQVEKVTNQYKDAWDF
ncbi:MAG TPA: HDOD domain-containing protein [Desulfuromonadales bacterium]|nr:HDOD domain-containing protein [Desulfuromonadales bacterium]